jgi:septum formation protein
MQIILASDSPRRKQLLSLLISEFKAVSHKVNEDEYMDLEAEDLVGQLAIAKATSVEGELVIGSDLVVATKDMIVSKPKDLAEARKFLKKLAGKKHSVYCGVALLRRRLRRGKPFEEVVMSVARSDVVMKDYDDKIIEEYIKKFHVLDKGGAYAIQFELPGYGSLVKSFQGGITTIIGLPLDYLANLLKEFGVKVKPDWPERCKIETGYEY